MLPALELNALPIQRRSPMRVLASSPSQARILPIGAIRGLHIDTLLELDPQTTVAAYQDLKVKSSKPNTRSRNSPSPHGLYHATNHESDLEVRANPAISIDSTTPHFVHLEIQYIPAFRSDQRRASSTDRTDPSAARGIVPFRRKATNPSTSSRATGCSNNVTGN